MSLKNKKQPKVTKKLAWLKGTFPSGTFQGPFWGAKAGDTFLMIVPRAATKTTGAYYELWTDGIVHDETKSKTLAAAQAFAETALAPKKTTRKAA